MAKTLIGGIQIVKATKGRESQFWAAATPRDKAAAAVQKRLSPGWTAELTNQRLSLHQAATLKLRPNRVQRLDSDD
jgi:hypothetical protein